MLLYRFQYQTEVTKTNIVLLTHQQSLFQINVAFFSYFSCIVPRFKPIKKCGYIYYADNIGRGDPTVTTNRASETGNATE